MVCRAGVSDHRLIPVEFIVDPDFFRQLLVLPPANEARESNSSDSTRPPLVELLCGYLRTRHPEANDTIVSGRFRYNSLHAQLTTVSAEQHDSTSRPVHLFHHVLGRVGRFDSACQ